MLNDDVFAMMKKLMGSKVPHDICMLNGLLVLNAHELLSEVVELREARSEFARKLKRAAGLAVASEPLSRPSEEAPAAGPTVGAEPPTATGDYPKGVSEVKAAEVEREFDTQKLIEDAQGRMQAAWERGFIDGYLSGPCDSSKYLQTDLQFAYEFGHSAGTKSKEGREIRFYGGAASGVKA